MQVLIAEDDLLALTVLRSTLAKSGYDPVVARNGTTALAVLQAPNPPRIAVLDWMMPGKTGVELARHLRREQSDHYTYIILNTAKKGPDDIVEAFDAGVDGFLRKPFHPTDLQAHMRAARRLLELDEQRQRHIAELKRKLEMATGVAGAAEAEAGGSVSRLSTMIPLERLQECAEKTLRQIGYQPPAEPPSDLELTVYTALVFPEQELWLDVRIELTRAAAIALYRALTREECSAEADLRDALGEICNLFQGEWKEALEAAGSEPLTPLVPRTKNSAVIDSIYSDNLPGRSEFSLPGSIRVTFLERLAKTLPKVLGSVQSGDVLADPLLSPNRKLTFLNRGILLNERYIQKISELLSDPTATVPVIEPSLMARQIGL